MNDEGFNNIKAKINKLLMLSTSQNENEAKLAMEKAYSIMKKYQISLAELNHLNRTVFKEIRMPVMYSTVRDYWVEDLSDVIARYTSCITYGLKEQGKRTIQLCFKGAEEDLELCVNSFNYAYEYLKNKSEDIKLNNKKSKDPLPLKELRSKIMNYAIGFCEGLEKMYLSSIDECKDQTENWMVVCKTPQVLLKELNDIENSSTTTYELDAQSYKCGEKDGASFNFNRKLE